MRGYIEFYVKTKNLRRTPFYIISTFNAILLVVAVALEDYCDNNLEDPGCQAKETKVEVLRGLIAIECLSVGFMWLVYSMDTKKFMKAMLEPDMWREDFRNKVFNMQPRDASTRMASTPGTSNGANPSVDPPVYPVRPPSQEYIMELQAELLVLLCPAIGYTEDIRQRITNYDPTVERHVS